VIQIASERLDNSTEKVKLSTDDFKTALAEMSRFLGGTDGKMIGFTQNG
jgi:hypothetical protein